MKNGVMRVSLLFTFFVLFVATLKGVTGDEYDHKVRETRNRLKMTGEGISQNMVLVVNKKRMTFVR